MKGLMIYGPEDIRYEDIPDPQIAEPEDVIVKVTHSALCGSDVHLYHKGPSLGDPFSIGHEAVGEIIEVGSGIRDRKVGDKVFMPAATGCGHCPSCLKGIVLTCETFDYLRCYGLGMELGGCQAEKLLVHNGDYNARLIPQGVTEEQAILLVDILPTAYLGCVNADVKPGKSVAVIGLGPVGLLAVECAFILGASRVFAIDLVPERRDMAAKLGAIALASADSIYDATNGKLVDCVIEVVGSVPTVDLAFELVANYGTVSIMTTPTMQYSFPLMNAFMKNWTVRASLCSVPQYLPEIISLVQGKRLKPEHVLTHRMKLSEGAVAYDKFVNRKEGTVKTILTP